MLLTLTIVRISHHFTVEIRDEEYSKYVRGLATVGGASRIPLMIGVEAEVGCFMRSIL